MSTRRKYLGPKYEDRTDYSVIISNHASYTDIFVYLKKFAPAFASKDMIKKVPIIGFVCESLEGLFINRESKDSTTVIVII